MTHGDDLIVWNSKWRLSGGMVFCRGCEAPQQEPDKELFFIHNPTCRYAADRSKPFKELDSITIAIQGSDFRGV